MSEATAVDVPTSITATDLAPRRIVLYGTASLYHDALKWTIETRSPQTSVTCTSDPKEAGSIAGTDLIVVDADLDKITDARLRELADLLGTFAPTPVLMLTAGVEPDVLQDLLREGVAGVVMRSSSCETLLTAIESVANGKVWLQRDLLAQTFGESTHPRRVCSEARKISQVTEREREIVRVACSGLTNRQVAKRLHISEATVRHHLSSIFSKLGVGNRGELIVFAYRHGLADEDERQRLC